MLRPVVAAILALLSIFPLLHASREAGGLVSRDWRLAQHGDMTNPTLVARDWWTQPMLRFGEALESHPSVPSGEHPMTVYDGCNHRFGISYRVKGDRLLLNVPARPGGTLKGCPGYEPQDDVFIENLRQSERFTVRNNTLTMFYDGGNSAMVFESK
jgi:hypothetical protein